MPVSIAVIVAVAAVSVVALVKGYGLGEIFPLMTLLVTLILRPGKPDGAEDSEQDHLTS